MARQAIVAIRTVLVMTLLLGIAYPLTITAIGRMMPGAADGSWVFLDGERVGSSLIGQAFDGPKWFQPRPSAAGEGYDALASAGSNLGADSAGLRDAVAERRLAIIAADNVVAAQVPPDAVTASGSGLDPHISPEYAAIQVDRVAAARGIPVDVIEDLVAANTEGRILGFVGEPTVNVVTLNLALAEFDDLSR